MSSLIEVAHQLADAASTAVMPFFRHPSLESQNKAVRQGEFDPVTAADYAAEMAMREVLARLRPEDGIYGEEQGLSPGSSGIEWVLDPIDGTRAFLSGAPSWGILIGARYHGHCFLGIMDQPYTGERFIGLQSSPVHPESSQALLQHRGGVASLQTRQCSSLEEAVLFTTFPEIGSAGEKLAFDAVRSRVRLTRYGLDCYAYALLSLGCIDLVIEAGLKVYDIQPLIPIIEASGGIVTNWQGGSVSEGGQVIAAGSVSVHQQAVEILSRFPVHD